TACANVAPLAHMTRVTMHLSPDYAQQEGPYGIRTRAAAVRGRCPRPLDEWAERGVSVAPAASKRPRRARLQLATVAGSSNGRTPDSGSGSQGSSPCPAASQRLGCVPQK